MTTSLHPLHALVLLALTAPAPAETHYVSPGPGSRERVQDAIDLAQDGDVIHLTGGTWVYLEDFAPFRFSGKAITVQGETDGSTVLSVAGLPINVDLVQFDAGEGPGSVLRDLVFDGEGDRGGVILVEGSSPTLERCHFRDLEANIPGCGVAVVNGTLDMADCTFEGVRGSWGACIAGVGSTVRLRGCTFLSCVSTSRGAAFALSSCSLDLEGCRFEDNVSYDEGGALHLDQCTGSLRASEFLGNAAGEDGGAVHLDGAAGHLDSPALESCTFSGNLAYGRGGALCARVHAVLIDCDLSQNWADDAGGAATFNAGGVAAACHFEGNRAARSGGLQVWSSGVLWGCTFLGNEASTHAGGAELSRGSSLVLDCLFEGNEAPVGGGLSVGPWAHFQTGALHEARILGTTLRGNGVGAGEWSVVAGMYVHPQAGLVEVQGCLFEDHDAGPGSPGALHVAESLTEQQPVVTLADTVLRNNRQAIEGAWVDLGGTTIDFFRPGQEVNALLFAVRGRPATEATGALHPWELATYEADTGRVDVLFDGADVGLKGKTIDAVARLADGSLLLSLTGNGTLPDLQGGPEGEHYRDEDLLRFTPRYLGRHTAGSWSFYLDGSDVGLTLVGEDIDALAVDPDGSLLVSTAGKLVVPGVDPALDEDVLRFAPEALGAETAGTWSPYLDGSALGLASPSEDVDALTRPPSPGEVHDLLLSSAGPLDAGGLAAGDEDVVRLGWSGLPGGEVHATLELWADGPSDLGLLQPKGDLTGLHWARTW